MKRILFVRHGKAIDQKDEQSDFERYLHDKGKRDAKIIAETLGKYNISPGLFITSPALRAYETAQIFARVCNYPEDKINKQQLLYDGYTTGQLIESIKDIAEDSDIVVLFGHNPFISQSAIRLSKNFHRSFPTAGCLSLKFDIDNWEIEPESGDIEFFEFPKKYR